MRSILSVLIVAVLLQPSSCFAENLLDGYFIAQENCSAYQSIKQKTNPGHIQLSVDMAYRVKAKNKTDASFYRIVVKNAEPQERWVPVSCGTLLTNCRKQSVSAEKIGKGTRPNPSALVAGGKSKSKDYILALSLLPAFCQTHQYKDECQSQTADRYDADHLSLHGLWPQPRDQVYCNVSEQIKSFDKNSQWRKLPDLELSGETYNNLKKVMPGVISNLHKHEWFKHGGCYSETAEEYFQESIMLLEQLNGSRLQKFLASHIGQTVTDDQIEAAFEAAFGEGTGAKLQVKCRDGLINELWISLHGEINSSTEIATLLADAQDATNSCSSGLIDPAGY